MFGIGLGAFVDGMKAGADLREKMDERVAKKLKQQQQSDLQNAARAEFDQQVAAGQQSPDNFDAFYKSYIIPRQEMQLLKDGKVEEAKKWREFAESDAATRGAKLFGSALLKVQTGDEEGAFADVLEASKVKGYLSHGVDIAGYQPIMDREGNRQGWRVTFKNPNGEETVSDFRSADLPNLIATYGNPQAAFESHQKAAAEQKREAKTSAKSEQSLREKAIKRLDDQYDGGLDGSGPTLATMDAAERERLITGEMELLRGGPAASSGTPGAARAQQAPGLSGGLGGLGGSPAAAAVPETAAAPGIIMDRATGQPVPQAERQQPAPQQAATANAGKTGFEQRELPPIGLGLEPPAPQAQEEAAPAGVPGGIAGGDWQQTQGDAWARVKAEREAARAAAQREDEERRKTVIKRSRNDPLYGK